MGTPPSCSIILSDEGSNPEGLSRTAHGNAALTKLKLIWRDNNISLGSNLKRMRSFVISKVYGTPPSYSISLADEALDEGSKSEVLSRIAQDTAALTKLKPIWRDNNISLGSKVN